MVVQFYRTTSSGQKEIGQIRYKNGRLTIDEACRFLARDLFGDRPPADKASIEKLMAAAPVKFDGAYVRASLAA